MLSFFAPWLHWVFLLTIFPSSLLLPQALDKVEQMQGLFRGFYRSKGGKTAIFVQNFDLFKAYFPQQVELKKQRAGRIFLVDVIKNLIAISFVFEPGEIRAVSLPHHRLDVGG